ncbi:nucleic-acid-binding protein from transposon X-element [Trichonephila clavipes]|nr:nucleic-acid-binding protein from transposon X-element [Trichonephila clavipes]
MSASRTDVASSIEVSDLFTLEPLSFDVMAATDYIDNCTTCAESEDLCGILDEILYTLEDVDAEVAITPERLRLVNLVQWAALKCSRRSIRLQNAEFKKYIWEVELAKRTPTAASPASQQKRRLRKRFFPTSAEEHRIIQKFVSTKKCGRIHSRWPTISNYKSCIERVTHRDYNQEELIVSVEPLNKSILPPQCYRCQEFFHHSRFCTRAPKCLKCSGGHLTSECPKSAKAPAKCANCSGPHPANFSGCPKNPINTKTTKSKAAKNVWQERAAARKQNSKQSKPSFAEVVKGSKNNSLDAKEVMTKMAQMMSQWGNMLSLLQSKL